MTSKEDNGKKEKVALASVLLNFILAVGKVVVGLISKSTAVLAEGVHSGMDVLSSMISFFGIKVAKKPVDEKHPYGHYKYEVLSGIVITLFLLGTGLWILYEAYQGFVNPHELTISYLALGVMLFSAVSNEIMARYKIKVGKKENSLSLLSDGTHDRVDVFTSIAVFIGVIIAPYWIYIDALLAGLIGLYIIKESLELGKEATDSLLDVSAGEEAENKIKKIVKEEDIDLEDLKTQKKGSAITANLQIKLPKDLKVDKATTISNKLKEKLINKIDHLQYVAIQIASHDVSSSYYKPSAGETLGLGRGFGWQGRGRFEKAIPQAEGGGPGGYCVCPECGEKVKHERGKPCATIDCPECGARMTRSVSKED